MGSYTIPKLTQPPVSFWSTVPTSCESGGPSGFGRNTALKFFLKNNYVTTQTPLGIGVHYFIKNLSTAAYNFKNEYIIRGYRDLNNHINFNRLLSLKTLDIEPILQIIFTYFSSLSKKNARFILKRIFKLFKHLFIKQNIGLYWKLSGKLSWKALSRKKVSAISMGKTSKTFLQFATTGKFVNLKTSSGLIGFRTFFYF